MRAVRAGSCWADKSVVGEQVDPPLTPAFLRFGRHRTDNAATRRLTSTVGYSLTPAGRPTPPMASNLLPRVKDLISW